MGGVIYKIENNVNGKVYIGQTIVGFEVRIRQHKSALRHNRHPNNYLQRSWNKYGESNFKYSVIEHKNICDIDFAESGWITHYKNRSGVYNLESGGSKNKKHSELSRLKMSISTKAALSRSETKRRIRAAGLKRRGKNNHKSKEVICINTKKVYDSITDASKDTNIPISDISRVLNGNRITAGFHLNGEAKQFAYYEKNKDYNLKETVGLHERRKVVLTNTREVFETATQGAKKYNLSQGSVSSCCKGFIKSAGKLPNGEYSVWVYEQDYDPEKDYFFHRHLGTHNPRAKKVVCITTGEVFETMREAGERYNIGGNGCKISLACTGKRKHVGKHPDGRKLQWAYYEDYQALR